MGPLKQPFGKYREPVMRPESKTMSTLYKTPFTKATIAGRRGPVEIMQDLDPMMLWFLNTTGCRRQLLLSYFDDPNLFQSQINSQYICCDNCLGEQAVETSCVGIELSFSLCNYYLEK